MLQRTLHIPTHKRKVTIDYLGAILIAAGVSLLLIWVSLAGNQFDWGSVASIVMVVGAVVLLGLAVLVEFRAKEPIIPMALFKNRTFWLAIIASISVGVAMFGTSRVPQPVHAARPRQDADGVRSADHPDDRRRAPVVASSSARSSAAPASGSATWCVGSILLTIGLALMGTIRYDTSFVLVFLYMFVMGAGVGMVMQNLVLIVQNAVNPLQIGTASASVAFFRSLGGTIGVSVMGAVLGSPDHHARHRRSRQARYRPRRDGRAAGAIPNLATLPGPVRTIVESAYGEAVADVFLLAVPLAVISIIAIALPAEPEARHEDLGRADRRAGVAAGTLISASGADVAGDPAGEALLDEELARATRAGRPGERHDQELMMAGLTLVGVDSDARNDSDARREAVGSIEDALGRFMRSCGPHSTRVRTPSRPICHRRRTGS